MPPPPATSSPAPGTEPLVSVVIPVRDAHDVIEEQLAALAAQQPGVSWEIVVADNGSQDGTLDVLRRWRERLPHLRVVDASAVPGSGHARNAGAAAARGRRLVFCDADDIVGEDWLAAHVAALEEHALVTGPLDVDSLNDPETARLGRRLADTCPPVGNAFLPYAVTANLGVRREVFDEVGGFDATRPNGNDKVFSWSAILAGHRLHAAEGASIHYRLRATPGSTWRRQYRIGRGAASLYARFAPHGMPRSSFTDAARDWLRLLRVTDLFDRRGRLAYLRRAGRRVGRLVGSVQARRLYL